MRKREMSSSQTELCTAPSWHVPLFVLVHLTSARKSEHTWPPYLLANGVPNPCADTRPGNAPRLPRWPSSAVADADHTHTAWPPAASRPTPVLSPRLRLSSPAYTPACPSHPLAGSRQRNQFARECH